MPWNLILTTLLPIILQPSHPHAPEAHQVLSDAHAVAADPKPAPSDTIEVLTRCLSLCLKAQAVSGAAPTSTTQALAQALAGLVVPQPPAIVTATVEK